MEKRNIKVFIADDHCIFRSGLKILLTQLKNIDVVGEASNGQELVRRCIELSPDIILTDIGMPVMDGIAATKELVRIKSGSRVIVLSEHSTETPVLKMLEAGALGYLLKSSDSSEISEAISTVYQYKPYFCQQTTEVLTEIVAKKYRTHIKVDVYFSDREKEIMQLICREYTSKEIAFTLHLSKRTVEGHRTRIMDKIGAKSIAGIITYSIERGFHKN